jgi:Cdc6-like AAA superfamily ATPase
MTHAPSPNQPTEQETSERLIRDIERQLSIALLSEEFAAYRDIRNEFIKEFRADQQMAREEFDSQLGEIIANERTQQENVQDKKRQRAYLRNFAILLSLVALYFMVTIPLGYSKIYATTPHIRTLTSVVLIEIAALLFIIIVSTTAGAVMGILPAAQTASRLSNEHARLTRKYEAALQIFVTEQMRLIIPTLPDAVAKVAFLQFSSALVELALSEPVSTKTLKNVQQFVTGHRASALGLAGPRGVGKSTILRFLTSMEHTLGIYIPAPVRYEPNELLARMFENLASEYLKEDRQRSPKEYRRPSSRVMLALMITVELAALLIGVGGLLVIRNPQFPKMDMSRWLGVFIVVGGLAFLFYLILRFIKVQRNRLSNLREESPAKRAQSIMDNLRWQRQQTSSSAMETKPWGGLLRFSRDTSATTTEREVGRPRLVADFQDFIRMIRKQDEFHPTPIIIAIDELDKLASADDLIAVINEIKDVLHIEGTHVIVSVSREALSRFLLRGLPYRDVFDSTFDEIIEVPMLGPVEAVEILKKRAIEFPVSWGLACYVLSAGLPRDLLRYGRRCVAIYQETDATRTDVPMRLVGEVAAEKTKAELQTSGTLMRMTDRGRDELDSALQAAMKGSISEIAKFANELYPSPLSPINRWLGWLAEVMEFLETGISYDQTVVTDSNANSAESLARRGEFATTEIL